MSFFTFFGGSGKSLEVELGEALAENKRLRGQFGIAPEQPESSQGGTMERRLAELLAENKQLREQPRLAQVLAENVRLAEEVARLAGEVASANRQCEELREATAQAGNDPEVVSAKRRCDELRAEIAAIKKDPIFAKVEKAEGLGRMLKKLAVAKGLDPEAAMPETPGAGEHAGGHPLDQMMQARAEGDWALRMQIYRLHKTEIRAECRRRFPVEETEEGD